MTGRQSDVTPHNLYLVTYLFVLRTGNKCVIFEKKITKDNCGV